MDSFSLEGEDLTVSRYLGYQSFGFYVDIGAHHPSRYSNTYLFYLQGWRGINIDPSPGSSDLFNSVRPNDINLEIAISNETGPKDFYIFEEGAYNSFNKELSLDRQKRGNPINEIIKIETYTLKSVLDRYLPSETNINLMSIDAEGDDLSILESNDWLKYVPEVIIVECCAYGKKRALTFSDITSMDICRYLSSKGYEPFGKTCDNVLFSLQV